MIAQSVYIFPLHRPRSYIVLILIYILRRNLHVSLIIFLRAIVQGTFVDFFNPKMRRELEKKDEDIKRTTGLKGAAPGGDEWSYLTSYSRVPVSV